MVELKKEGDATPNGASEASPKLSEEELAMRRQVLGQLAGMIAPFCPNLDEAALLQLAAEGLAEQQEIHEKVMPTFMAGTEAVTRYPTIRVSVQAPNGVSGTVAGPKRLEGVDDPQPAITQALLVALMLTPSVRAVLKAWGFKYSFEQSMQDLRQTPPLIHKV